MTSTIDFNERADDVAPQLLGAVIWRGEVGIQLTEVEAYLGESDAASHAFKGPTPRCATMFGPPGHLYVYASYGIHRAGNLVCSPEGVAGGVLLRAGRVIAGHEIVRERRGPKPTEDGLARGPGNLGACLGLDLHLNGATVHQLSEDEAAAWRLSQDNSVGPEGDRAVHQLGEGTPPNSAREECALGLVASSKEEREIRVGKRIGITKNAEVPLRFWIAGDRTVTSPRR